MTVYVNRSRFNALETNNDRDIYIESDLNGVDLMQLNLGEDGKTPEWDHIAICRRIDLMQLIEKLKKIVENNFHESWFED